jgi:hypothetical protein
VKHGGNVHEKGIVAITSSSVFENYPQYRVTNLGDPNSARSFCSEYEANQWVQWDFIERRVIPVHYSIQAHRNTLGSSHLKSWVIEGSMYGLRWTELDRETNNNDLNGSLMIHSFSISKSIECRFIRLRQTGENHANNDVNSTAKPGTLDVHEMAKSCTLFAKSCTLTSV